jgi:hypothetical protein
MTRAINFRIILQAPTPGVVYGLQKGKGSTYETVQKQVSNSSDLIFQFNVEAKQDDDDSPIFLGPYTQGTPQDRFVYIDIGTYAGQKDSKWSRRLKIPLSGISARTLKTLSENDILECKVPGSEKNGSPNCATVKPFSGWKLTSSF